MQHGCICGRWKEMELRGQGDHIMKKFVLDTKKFRSGTISKLRIGSSQKGT